MTFSVKFSEQAADDLEAIIKYISEDLDNPRAAENFYHVVNEKLGSLRDHPQMFPLYHDDKLSAEGYRFAVIGNFLMFYLVDDDKSIVNIARILYGKQDISAIMA